MRIKEGERAQNVFERKGGQQSKGKGSESRKDIHILDFIIDISPYFPNLKTSFPASPKKKAECNAAPHQAAESQH